MYPQRPHMGHARGGGGGGGQGLPADRDSRAPHDLRHLPQQDPHHRPPPPDAKTGERGASNTNPYSHFEKGGGVGSRTTSTNQPPTGGSGDEGGKPANPITAASLIDAIITNTINRNSEGDQRSDSLGLLSRLQATEQSPRSQVVPPSSGAGPGQQQQPVSYASHRGGPPPPGPAPAPAHSHRSPPYKPHRPHYEAEGPSRGSAGAGSGVSSGGGGGGPPPPPPISGGSITAGLPVHHPPHHAPSSSSAASSSSTSSAAVTSSAPPTIASPNAAAITLGEHIDYIILQDYNGKNPPPPGALAHAPKDDGAGIARRKSSASCLTLSMHSCTAVEKR